MQVSQVVWDDDNRADIAADGYTTEEIEDVLRNHRNDTRIDRESDGGSLPLTLTTGEARTGRRITVKCAFVCGNPLHVYPIAAYPA